MMPLFTDKRFQREVYDDFAKLDTAATNGQWLGTKGTGGTLALTATNNSDRISVPTAASANDYYVLSTQQKVFQLVAGKPLWCEALVNVSEANTNNANWFVGLTSTVSSGFLQTGNAGLPTSWDGALWYKIGGALALGFATSKAAAAVANTSLTLSNGSSCSYVSGTDYVLGFTFDPGNGTTGYVTPHYNGQPVFINGVVYRQPIALSSAALYLAFGVMAGSASAETITLDYVRCVQDR